MTEQVQEKAQEQQITVGFAKALHQYNPDWRNALSKDEVNRFRYFYSQGVQDVSLVVHLQQQSLAQNVLAIRNTIAVTGNEDEIARLQAEQAAAEAAALAAVSTDQVQALNTTQIEALAAMPTEALTPAEVNVEVDQCLNDQIQADVEHAAADAEAEVPAEAEAEAGCTNEQAEVPAEAEPNQQ